MTDAWRLSGSRTDRLGAKLVSRGFVAVRDVEFETRKLDLIRIAVALFSLWRYGKITIASTYYYTPTHTFLGVDFSSQTLMAVGVCVLLTLLAAGFCTPLVIVCLFVTYSPLDNHLWVSNLGTEVLCLMFIVFLLSGTGRTLSLDAVALRQSGRLNKVVRALYRPIGAPSENQLVVLYAALLLAYGMVSMLALFFHVSDATWLHGRTVEVMSTSSYLSHTWRPSRWLQEHIPFLIAGLSIVSIALQTAWQMWMLPMSFFRVTRWWVIAHGIAFFMISLVVLQLSYLPLIELMMWMTIWLHGPFNYRQKLHLLFDDRCSLCARSVRTLRALDLTGVYGFNGLSRSEPILAHYNLKQENVYKHMHAIYNNRIYVGYDAYRAAVRYNAVLWILIPLFELGQLTRIGPAIYGWVASRRTRLYGACEINAADLGAKVATTHAGWSLTAVTLLGAWVALMVLSPAGNPVLREKLNDKGVQVSAQPNQRLLQTLHYTGLETPNVFNENDLRIGDSWLRVWRVNPTTGKRHEVPFSGADGQRGSYLENDLLYFGTDVQLRRMMTLGTFSPQLTIPGSHAWELMQRIARYDSSLTGERASRYEFEQFKTHGSDISLPTPERYRPALLHTYVVTQDFQ